MSFTLSTLLLATAVQAPAAGPAVELLATPQPSGWSSFWWGRWDADELADAYVIQPDGSGRLLRNAGDGSFEDVTERAGLDAVRGARIALWADADGDGRQDLYLVVPNGASRLWRNTGAGLFEDATARAGLEQDGVAFAEFVDYDADGRADLHVSTATEEVVYHNQGAGSFERVAFDRPLQSALETARAAFVAGGSAGTTSSSGAAASPAGRTDRGETDNRNGGARSAMSGGVVGPASTQYTGGQQGAGPGGFICAGSLEDFVNPGVCMNASTVPTMGMLYPMSTELNVDAATGRVCINTLTPTAQLDVNGDVQVSDQIRSTLPDGTAPFEVASTTVVPNLNVDQLDGLDATDFRQTGVLIGNADIADNSITSGKIAPDVITAADIAANGVGAAEIATNAVGASEIAAGAVGASEIATGAVGSSEILDGSVLAGDLGASQVTTVHVLDGTLLNADVSSAAAIAGTKIAPNFGTQNVVTTGNVGAGIASPAADLHVVGSTALGTAIIAPSASVNNNSELILAEGSSGVTGFKLQFEGNVNQLRMMGRGSGTDYAPTMVMTRDTGYVGIGHTVPSAPLDVAKASTAIVAEFEQTDAFGASPVVRMTQNSAGSVLQLVQDLTGQGLDIDINYTGSTATGVSSRTVGTGWAGWFYNANTGTVGSSLHAGSLSTHSSHYSFTATNSGAGGAGAGSFYLSSLSSTGTGLNSRTRGSGDAIHGDAEGGGDGVFGEANGTGRGGFFQANSVGGVALAANNVDNTSTGNILTASNGADLEFRVENSGNVFCDGSFTGGGADYAEWLERVDRDEELQAGDVVGVFGGRVSLRTEGAEQLMVVSTNPVVIGNALDAETGTREHADLVAFIGQAPVRVVGAVRAGDFLVPSGLGDGVAFPVSAERIDAGQLTSVIGVAWEEDLDTGEKLVNCAIGIDEAQAAAIVIQRLQKSLGTAQRDLAGLAGRMARVESSLGLTADVQ